jgi:hypothetical protein
VNLAGRTLQTNQTKNLEEEEEGKGKGKGKEAT